MPSLRWIHYIFLRSTGMLTDNFLSKAWVMCAHVFGICCCFSAIHEAFSSTFSPPSFDSLYAFSLDSRQADMYVKWLVSRGRQSAGDNLTGSSGFFSKPYEEESRPVQIKSEGLNLTGLTWQSPPHPPRLDSDCLHLEISSLMQSV